MHQSAMTYGKFFFETYCPGDCTGKIIVDVGSQDVNGSLRQFTPSGAIYKGVDFTEGKGVDIVISDPYNLPFDDESVDIIVCSSVFEHSEFFWLLFLDCIRILKPAGLMYLNVPSNGMIHRYPIDSWRFYPDAGLSLTNWANHNLYNTALLESFFANKQGPISGEGQWNDFVAIFIKNREFSSIYQNRIQDLTTTTYHNYNNLKEQSSPRHAEAPDHELILGLKRTIDTQLSEIGSLTAELCTLHNSTSWKLTKPLRNIKSLIMNHRITAKYFARKILRTLWNALPKSADGLKSRIYSMIRPVAFKPSVETTAFDWTQEGYVDRQQNPKIASAVKLIAFYLPQFHPFPENDQWWGKGFTEWSNVGRAEKNYIGHYQPHCPIHNGYYDLRIPSIMEEQASLAKQYGVYGFSYYFYWFAGKILMDTPLEAMLKNQKIDMPFCLTWANENWTRRWDGQDNDVLIAQNHCSADSIAFIQHLVKYFNDPRYIRIDGKPVLIIYRAGIIPDMRRTVALWREEVKKFGISDLYLICAQTFGTLGPDEFGMDASVEFPPHTSKSHEIQNTLEITNPEFKGRIYSYDQVVSLALSEPEPTYKLFRTPMLSWDNTARKQNNGHIFHGFSLTRYKQWLSALCSNVFHSDKYSSDEKIVFINAWNEWAEGTHLEPDRKYGYGYLQATYDVVSRYDSCIAPHKATEGFTKKNCYAVVLHVHYQELWPEILLYLANLSELGFDLFVTTTQKEVLPIVLADFPDAFVELHENRGRDIFPFTKTINHINSFNYKAVCKLHTKRSIYRNDGDRIRHQLFNSLIGNEASIQAIAERFDTKSSLGMIVPADFLIAHTHHNMTYDHEVVGNACEILDLDFQYDTFPAGSMFWFRPESLRDLNKFKSCDFDVEQGLTDGTLPHAIERIFCLLVKKAGYTIETC